jgi:hypothetical protein
VLNGTPLLLFSWFSIEAVPFLSPRSLRSQSLFGAGALNRRATLTFLHCIPEILGPVCEVLFLFSLARTCFHANC